MKKILYLILGAFMVSSCSLDTFPGGDLVSVDQRDDANKKDPEKLISFAKGISANYIKFNVQDLSSVDHNDYGYAALCQFLDMSGQDFLSIDGGYNWFRSTMLYRDRTLTAASTEMMWRTYYNIVASSNSAIEAILPLLENEGMAQADRDLFNFYIAQGYVNRALAYFQLVQSYQFTYKGNEDKPAVPLTLTKGDDRAVANRATVQQVYDVIVDDLTKAVEILKNLGTDVLADKDKSYVNLQVAYGMFARVSLVMNDWAKAAEYAKLAQDGYTPYSLNDLKKPILNSANVSSWMWANLISENNEIVQTGIINWPSHMCSFSGNAYSTAGAYRSINSNLWNEIDESDARKTSWWVDADLNSPYTDGLAKIKGHRFVDYMGFEPYSNIKFGAYKDILLNTINASDWPLMRVEEMILIEAEAKAMAGDLAGGKSVLENFLNTYRYKEGTTYTSTASSPEEFQNEVWVQRRIELWGEGFSFFDLKRLNKPVVRVKDGESSFPPNARFNINANDDVLLWLIPEKEIEANPNLSSEDNNPIGTKPTPLG